MLEWDDLQAFLAVARHGTLSAAARAMGVRQTTMGRRLAGFEQRAGARLLQKTPRGYVLTQAGEAILGNVERIESEAVAIERSIAGRDARLEGAVRLTTVEILAVEVIVPAMPEFRRRHPGITLDIAVDTRNVSLTMREADIALRLARLRQHDLAVRKVAEIGFALYAADSYFAAHGTPDFAAAGAGHWLIHNEADQMDQPEMAWFLAALPQARPALRTNDRYAQRAAAVAGIGIAFLARAVGDSAGLVRLHPPTRPPHREAWLAAHTDIRHTPRIRAVTDFLASALREAAPRLRPPDEI